MDIALVNENSVKRKTLLMVLSNYELFLQKYTIYEIVLFERVNCRLLHSYSSIFRRSSPSPSSQQKQERYIHVFQDVFNK